MKDIATLASVQPLTATVRILQVGSWQITLSVAQQLDHVHFTKINAFGRVRITMDYVEVIGADADGNLVRSSVNSEDENIELTAKDLSPFFRKYNCATDGDLEYGDMYDGYVGPSNTKTYGLLNHELSAFRFPLAIKEPLVLIERDKFNKYLISRFRKQLKERKFRAAFLALPLIVFSGRLPR